MYYSELKMTEELSKHVFKELNVLYQTIKANLHVKPAVLYRRQKNLITGINVSVEFIINLSQNPYHFSLQVFPKLWEANTRSMVATIFILMMLRTLHFLSKKPRYWRVQNNVVALRKLCAAKPTIPSERHQVLSICLSRFSNTQSILLTLNFTSVCGTLVNFFDSYNLILFEYFLLTSPWFVSRILLNELWSTCLYSH